jgi:hypothetical protein
MILSRIITNAKNVVILKNKYMNWQSAMARSEYGIACRIINIGGRITFVIWNKNNLRPYVFDGFKTRQANNSEYLGRTNWFPIEYFNLSKMKINFKFEKLKQ